MVKASSRPASEPPDQSPQSFVNAARPPANMPQRIERRVAARELAATTIELASEEAALLATWDERMAFWDTVAKTAAAKLAIAMQEATEAKGERVEVNPKSEPAEAKKTDAIRPPDQKAVQGDPVSEALDLADECLSLINDLPDRDEAMMFGESVGEKVRAIAETIEDRQHVTTNQMAALENMRDGLSRWIR